MGGYGEDFYFKGGRTIRRFGRPGSTGAEARLFRGIALGSGAGGTARDRPWAAMGLRLCAWGRRTSLQRFWFVALCLFLLFVFLFGVSRILRLDPVAFCLWFSFGGVPLILVGGCKKNNLEFSRHRTHQCLTKPTVKGHMLLVFVVVCCLFRSVHF